MLGTALVLALTLAQAQAAPSPRQSAPQTDETVAVQKGTRLNVNNFAGEVLLKTWDKDSLHVVARHQARARVNIRQVTGAVNITSSGAMGPSSVDYEITAPAWMPVRIEVFANTVRGDVVIRGGTGVITAKSVEGEVDIHGARGKVTVSSVNETVKIADSTGEITAETVNGDITMTGIDSKSVDASTVNGDIVYEGKIADGGHYAFNTHNGDISLGLPDNANATFSLRTYNGSVSTDFTLTGFDRSQAHRGRRVTATLGNGSADVSLETFGGAIRLRKGSVTRPSRGR
jgi:DUF4097 and DUF4098 domain-containing protein YvlB